MEELMLSIDAAFNNGGQSALVDYLLGNLYDIREACGAAPEQATPPQHAPPPPPLPGPLHEFQCPNCYSLDTRDDRFLCMKTCTECATCWQYFTDQAGSCLDYDDMVRAREQVIFLFWVYMEYVTTMDPTALALIIVIASIVVVALMVLIAYLIAKCILTAATCGSSGVAYTPTATLTRGGLWPPPYRMSRESYPSVPLSLLALLPPTQYTLPLPPPSQIAQAHVHGASPPRSEHMMVQEIVSDAGSRP